MPFFLASTLCAVLLASPAPAPAVGVFPAHARPGDAFLLLVRRATAPPSASVAGHPLAFFPVRGGFAAFGGLPVETPPGPLAIAVKPAPGEAHPQPLTAVLEIVSPHFPGRELHVPARFVEPPPPEVQARIDADRAALDAAFAQPGAPPLFRAPFAWPSRARVTAGYGEERTLNGKKPSQHYGLDFAGRLGDPVRSANSGRVVLVRDCWASGETVVVWHGAGLYTTYLHLSRALVSEGAEVVRGQRIGLVGRSGRASGPHLHWGVRVGDLYIDPRSLLALPRDWK